MKTAFLFAGSLSLLGLVGQAMPATATDGESLESTPVVAEVVDSVETDLALDAQVEEVQQPLTLADQSVSDVMLDVQDDSIGQVTDVNQLSDVLPTDWAFQALQALITRWGCIAGYPDGTFRGQQSATRFELAAALNACLDSAADKFATKEELEQVKRLQEEFAAELAVIKGRVDSLEARTDVLEEQQFSTTTKLQGEVVMAGQFGDFTDNPANLMPVPLGLLPGGIVPTALNNVGSSNATAISRVRLNFNSSFTGDDLLQTQLEVGNNGNDFFTAAGLGAGGFNPAPLPGVVGAAASTFVDLGALDYAGIGNTVILRRLAYSFKPFGPNATFTFGTNIFPSDFIDFNSYANNSAQDFGSGFFINNPLIITNAVDFAGGAGGAVDWNVNGGPFSVRALYVGADAGNAAGPGNNCAFCGGGLGGDPSQASLELEYADTFGSEDQNSYAVRAQYTRANTYNVHQNVVGLNFEATFNKFGVFGRAGYSIDPQIDTIGGVGKNDLFSPGIATGINNNIITWMGGLGYKDLFVPGSLLAVAGGQPFLVTDDGLPDQTNFELFYRFPVNNNITITPAVMYVINPFNLPNQGNGDNNNDIIQGVIRATFSF